MKPPPPPSGEKPPIRNKGGSFSETELAAIISGACDMIASFRGDHWLRTPQQCMPLARPLEQAITKMSPAMMKKVGEMSLPVSIVMGAYTVFGPAVNTEIYNAKLIAADKAANAGGASGGNLGADPAQSLYTQAGAPGNGNGGRAGNAAYDGQFVSDILR